MKKALLILAVAVAFTATAQGTKSVNDELKKVDAQIAKAKADALSDASKFNKLSIGSTDTLEIKPGVKFIKLNGKLINYDMLDKAMVILSEKDIEAFLTGIQEYPAKIANPFTQYFLKFFGLNIQEPKK